MSRDNVRRIAAGAREKNSEPPRPLMRELRPADPYPAEALDDVLAYAARAINERVQAPMAVCGQAPRTLPLSAQARASWIGFYNHIEARLGAGGELEPVRGLANKLPEHAARFAAVLALVDNIDGSEVGADEMRRGIALAEHYLCEGLRLFGASHVSGDLRLAQRLLNWLHMVWREPNISLPDIYQRSLNAIGDQATARRLVAILEDHGWLRRINEGAEINGKWRRDAWHIVREA